MRFKQPKLLDEKQTTVYKRAVDKNYNLKMKASRFIFSEISQKFPIMPFTARSATVVLSYECVSFMRNDYHVWLFIFNFFFPILFSWKRDLEEKRARLGLVECVTHDLLQPYPVLHEKPGAYVYMLFPVTKESGPLP